MRRRLIVDAGAGELLGKLPPFNTDVTGASAYTPGALTSESVAAAVQRMLGSSQHRAAAERLRDLSTEPGGAAAVAIRVEHAARHGVRHLHNEAIERRVLGSRPTIFYAAAAAAACVAAAAAAMILGASRG